jgi:hypothetical protein
MNSSKFVKIWNLADSKEQTTLSELCQKFFIQNFREVTHTIGFLTLKKSLLKRALATGDIDCSAEFILNALKGWARYQLLSQNIHCLMHNSEEKLYQYLEELLPPNTFFNFHNKMSLLNYYPNPIF